MSISLDIFPSAVKAVKIVKQTFLPCMFTVFNLYNDSYLRVKEMNRRIVIYFSRSRCLISAIIFKTPVLSTFTSIFKMYSPISRKRNISPIS